jgi:RNA polymerase sigma-70 factor (ECF subfamily)
VYLTRLDAQPDSFEELAMPLFDQLYNFAHWLTRNRTEAEDLVQETYTKALKGFSSFRLGTNFRAWMFRILRNTFLTSRTGLQASINLPLDSGENEPDLAAESNTPETILMERSNRQLVQSAVDDLPVYFREVLLSSAPRLDLLGPPFDSRFNERRGHFEPLGRLSSRT